MHNFPLAYRGRDGHARNNSQGKYTMRIRRSCWRASSVAISPRGTKRGIAKGIFSNTFDLCLDSMDITKANVEKNN